MRRKKSSYIFTDKDNLENVPPLETWFTEKNIISDHLDFENIHLNTSTIRQKAHNLINRVKFKIRSLLKPSKYFPVIKELKSYTWSIFMKDFIAGLSVGVASVPMGVSYALLAQMPAQYGLYNNFYYPLLYMLFGTSNVCLGTSAVEALMSASAVEAILGKNASTEEWMNMTLSFSFCAGITLLLFRIFNIASLTNFLAEPVISGFSSGAAIVIGTSQLPQMFGIKVPRKPTISTWIYLLRNLNQTNWACLLITICGMIIMILFQIWSNRLKKPLPGALFMLLLFLGLNKLFDWDKAPYNVPTIKTISSNLVRPRFISFSSQHFNMLLVESFKYAVVYIVIHVSIAKVISKKNKSKIDVYQEFLACGLCATIGSLFQCFAIATSVSRTVIADLVGAQTMIYNLSNSFVVLITITWVTPFLKKLPLASLAAVILFAARGMISFEECWEYYTHKTFDTVIWIVCCLATITYGPAEGVVIGVGVSLSWLIYKSAFPNLAVLGRLPNTTIYRDVKRFQSAKEIPGCKILRFDSSLNFSNKHILENKITDLLEQMNPVYKSSKYMATKANVQPSAVELISDLHIQSPSNNTPRIRSSKNFTEYDGSSQNKRSNGNILDLEQNTIGVPRRNDNLKQNIPLKVIILDVSGINCLDLTAVKSLMALYDFALKLNCLFLFANWRGTMRDLLNSTNFHSVVPTEHCFLSVHDAVRWARFTINQIESPDPLIEVDEDQLNKQVH